MIEFKRFIGLLILLGVYQGKKEPIRDIWNEFHGRPIFFKSMDLNRFETILRFLRFDDRSKRNKEEKDAPFREV